MSVGTVLTITEDEEGAGIDAGRLWVGLGAIIGLLAVFAGAAGTHALRGTLDPDELRTFETAVRFQMYHALALLATGLIAMRWNCRYVNLAGWLFVAGVALFSGSLYALAMTGVGAFGAIAPLGGLSLMAAWALLAVGALRR
ncbi:MAG: DUF423 domain-containing protein [Chloroflexi bacterium]|nr:DUF423 domain-containing protein [Chloroflexota bacterium]MCH9039046.1 DUF423 domain-containing protein [Chloroflexota bacterium]MCI0790698.1 DUF423 domain-containing protein [Chloroflexota bacterium]